MLTPGILACVAMTAPVPNVLFCLADDASFHHFSKSGCTFSSTPNFDRVANEGIVFNRCYTPNAKSAPSRAVILTGRYSWQLGEGGNHITNFPADVKVFTEVLRDAGYDVAFTGKSWAPGNPGTVDGKPRQLTGKPFQDRKTTPPTRAINSNDYAANFCDFLDSREGNSSPWFFWYGSTEPHRKYQYGSGESLGGKSREMIGEVPAFWPDTDSVRTDILDYAYEIEYFDAQIGKMMTELEKRGLLENTLVVITSDNGMPFPRCKANDYEYSNHMPLAMMWKRGIKKAGRSIDSYVSFIDLAPTFLDLAGVDAEKCGMKSITGKSLKCFVEDKTSKKEIERRREIYLGRERDDYGRPRNEGYPIRAIIRDSLLLIWNVKPDRMPAGNSETGLLDVDGSPTKTSIINLKRNGNDTILWEMSFGLRPEFEMYNIVSDPYCIRNLAGKPSFAAKLEELKTRMKEELVRTADPRVCTEDGDIFDRYPFDGADKWNFYERVMSGELKEPWKQTRWVSPSDYDSYKP